MKKIIILLLMTGLARQATMAQAPDPDTTARHFIIMASIGNLQEMSAANLAIQKAVHPGVKMFAQHMMSDHSKAQRQLMQLAKQKGFDIPSQATGGIMPDPMLKNASGRDFDRIYVHMMVTGHRQTVSMFENYALTGKNLSVKAFAQQTLPVLKQHLAAITALDSELKDTAK
jgi:putative membrane protein